jgi:GTP-binding protein
LDRKQVVFLGRSNVGKSTLVNAIVGQKLSFTSKTPGRTQMLSYFDLDGKYYLVDAPGYGFFADSALDFEPLMTSYLEVSPRILKRAYLLLDSRRELSQDDADVYNLVADKGISIKPVFTKCDKLNQSEKAKLNNQIGRYFSGISVIITSSQLHLGLDDLRKDICQALEK